MSADIPGFYFDVSKGKYFKIQPNHIAPADSRYSRQAVTAKGRLRAEAERVKRREEILDRNRLTRSTYLRSVHGSLLRRGLGERGRGLEPRSVVKYAYAEGLKGRTVFGDLKSPVFKVERKSGQLFAVRPRGMGWVLYATPLSTVLVNDEDTETGLIEQWSYKNVAYMRIYYAMEEVNFIEPLTENLVVWAMKGDHVRNANGAFGGSRVFISRTNTLESSGGERSVWCTNESDSGHEIWDMKAGEDGRRVAVAEGGEISIYDIEKTLAQRAWCVTTIKDGPVEMPFTCVSWQGENVVIGGQRSGSVWLADVREDRGSVRRASCPWAVTAVRSIGPERLLVWGLKGGRIFDLRFNKEDRNSREKITQPAIVFDVSGSWKQRRYGIGWEYDEQLGLVASATTDLFKEHKIGLWDVNTGKMIEGSPLTRHRFPEVVTCIQMVNIEGKGGVKSLLSACKNKIEAWEV